MAKGAGRGRQSRLDRESAELRQNAEVIEFTAECSRQLQRMIERGGYSIAANRLAEIYRILSNHIRK
jgi:hypothetical protein